MLIAPRPTDVSPRRGRLKRLTLALGAVLALSLFAVPAAAQSDADRAAAQALFDEGQRLMKGGDTEKACEKFEASRALDPAIGTQLNLANCFEKIGKTASAWVNFVEVAQNKKSGRRGRFAQTRADKLEPKLSHLTIEVEEPLDGMVVRRNGKKQKRATWGVRVPVDPGTYSVKVEAPGHRGFTKEIEVRTGAHDATLRVPALAERAKDAPEPDKPATPPKEGADGPSGQTVAGGVMIGLGGAGVIVSAVLTGMAHSKAAESEDFCLPADPNQCFAEGVELRESAQSLQVGYTVGYVLSGVLAAAGVATMLTAGDGKSDDGTGDGVGRVWIAPQLALPVAGGRGLGGPVGGTVGGTVGAVVGGRF